MTRRARVILLNGTSSAGKTTLAAALRAALAEPFCFFASDQLAEAGFRTIAARRSHPDARGERARFFDGFHRSIAAFAEAGNDMIVEHIVEDEGWGRQLRKLLAPFDAFWVGVHAPLAELERRERERGDRAAGEARFHLKTHEFCRYDLEVDTSAPKDEVVATIIRHWNARAAAERS